MKELNYKSCTSDAYWVQVSIYTHFQAFDW